MGDVMSLIEKVEQGIDQKKTEEMQRKLLEDEFTLADFRDQLKQLSKLGSLESLLGMMPKVGPFKELQNAKVDEKELTRVVAIVDSMTPHERANHMIINGSRRRRIAKGSGTTVQEVNQLLKQYAQARKMMKSVSGSLLGGKVGGMLGKRMAKLKLPLGGGMPWS
jgi:signal recognition particle subunit SRP54